MLGDALVGKVCNVRLSDVKFNVEDGRQFGHQNQDVASTSWATSLLAGLPGGIFSNPKSRTG
jgi:hypothetical protein